MNYYEIKILSEAIKNKMLADNININNKKEVIKNLTNTVSSKRLIKLFTSWDFIY